MIGGQGDGSPPKDLSVNNVDWQLDLAQRNDGGREMVERQKTVLKLLVAHQQLPEPVKPAVARLDHPAPSLLLRVFLFLRRFTLAADHMRDIAMCQDHGHGAFAAIARIGAQMLGAALLWSRTLDHDGIEHSLNLRHVVRVRSRHDERQRDATSVHQQMAFAAIFFPDPSDWGRQLLAPKGP